MKLVAAAAALTAVVGAAALAAGAGTSTDPLVTVSYLEQTFAPSVEQSVSSQISSARTSLENSFASRITAFQNNLSNRTNVSSAVSEYTTKTLAAGGSLDVTAGTEILFLSGSASVSTAGLTDASTGQALAAGGSMAENHLYLATSGCTITAEGEVKMLVR